LSTYAEKEFWDLYFEYAKKSRPTHKRAISSLLQGNHPASVVDLGCGQTCSAFHLLTPREYHAIDLETPERVPSHPEGKSLYLCADYREDLQSVSEYLKTHQIEFFCSLFSVECTSSISDNALYYQNLFEMVPCLKRGVVSGFYYSGRKDQEMVAEVGGLTSYQTIGDLVDSELFSETRVLLRNPSEMFGQDVVEVWRYFERNE